MAAACKTPLDHLAPYGLGVAASRCDSCIAQPPPFGYDRYSDPKNPKTIDYNHVKKANDMLKHFVHATPLLKSKFCKKFKMSLHFKIETRHITGSFHERSAMYALIQLSPEQRLYGVFTASVGNWAMALARQGQVYKVRVTVVLPEHTRQSVVDRCQDYGATVVLSGDNVEEARTRAFKLIAEQGRVGTYLNGYDHPNVIAAAGCIGVEILKQLPETDVIIVPVGGGGLIAGIASYVKHVKPNVLIYGAEPGKSCCFAKALDNERPYKTAAERGLAASLTVPKAGENAFHTARSLIDKMVLVHDDWTARAILHLIEEEGIVAEGAGAISLGALLNIPNILPELKHKKVVCVVSGANIDTWHLRRAIDYGKAAEGRMFTMTLRSTLGREDPRNKILRVIKYLQANVITTGVEQEWLDDSKLLDTYISVVCETKNFIQANTIKNLIVKFFPNVCEFTDDTFSLRNKCFCFPGLH
ncbi:hypothetical protein PYW07_007841 [Mythimna separata]|uniref:L-serine deaminase n=1 Tax=Mythimna separata TaxID=271217 RepID=A0AAD7YRL3_MYTSE|nr:hypothetical protein PYW07_007841 [Mythimna separata]